MTKLLYAALAGIVVGGLLAKTYWPTNRTEIRTQELVKADVRTVIRTVVRTDGSKEIVQETVDRSTRAASSSAVKSAPNWNLSVSAATRPWDFQPIYGVQLQRRVIGPVFAGLRAETDGTIGLTVGAEF